MKNIQYILMIVILSITFSSCEESFLDVKNVEAGVTVEDMYTRYNYVQGVVWETYSYLPNGLGDLWHEAATDVAEATSEGSGAQLFNMGIWNALINPDNVWGHYFRGINQANQYLKNMGKADLEYIKTSATATDSTNYKKAVNNLVFMEGEVLFLKAFFYFELVKRYGGVPIIEEALEYEDEASWKNLDRNTLDESIKYIVKLCDEAANIIPASMSAYSWYEDGRVTHGAIKALKARTLLYAASPTFQAAGSTFTWADAARAAHDVIALKQYSLGASFAALFGANNATSTEFIFKRRYGAMNWLEYNQFPISFVGSNGNSLTPTQNLVDQFEVVSGGVSENFNWNNPVHAAAPYANRDPRFAATVVYNESKFKTTTVETFTGGNNGLPKQNATKTGYYLLKWVNSSIDLVNNTSANHTWSYFRYSDILLGYAEAMLNAYGANNDPNGFGMTAIEAFNLVRKRAQVSELAAAELTPERIEKERMVELCFEGHRFWDVRRWGKGTEYFSKPVNRIVITKTGSNLIYEVKKLEDRVYSFKMDWYPIPQNEMIKTGWDQNPGW